MEKIHHLEVKFFDVDGDGKVDIRDLVKTAKRYKAVPRMRGYSLDYNFNGNSIIDIGALTTIAANIEGQNLSPHLFLFGATHINPVNDEYGGEEGQFEQFKIHSIPCGLFHLALSLPAS